jgi:hypothetical protein
VRRCCRGSREPRAARHPANRSPTQPSSCFLENSGRREDVFLYLSRESYDSREKEPSFFSPLSYTPQELPEQHAIVPQNSKPGLPGNGHGCQPSRDMRRPKTSQALFATFHSTPLTSGSGRKEESAWASATDSKAALLLERESDRNTRTLGFKCLQSEDVPP